MLQAGFEPAIPASERPQTHALDCAASGIGTPFNTELKYTQIGYERKDHNHGRTRTRYEGIAY
jgi:hypothetical protein